MSKMNWQDVKFYLSGDDYFRDVQKAVDKARSEIWVESYIFDMDPIGLRILDSLNRAHERGVKVHLLVDGVGAFNWLPNLKDYCSQKRIPFRIFHPLPIRTHYLRKISWRSLRKILFLLKRINKRNHRKLFLIDGERAFLGGLNVSQVHCKEFMLKKAWRDTGIQVTGPALESLRKACQQAWFKSKFDGLTFSGSFLKRRIRWRNPPTDLLRLNSSIQWRYFLLRDLNRRFKRAQKRILITNAYFVPRRSVLRALIKAAERGVYVGLCVPAVTDVFAVQWASKSLYGRLLRAGVHIYEYQNRVLHAKTLVIDDWATVGSHNLNHRSLTHDLEVEAVLTEPQWIQTLLNHWDLDIRESHAVTLADLGKMRWYNRVFYRFAYWFRYWL